MRTPFRLVAGEAGCRALAASARATLSARDSPLACIRIRRRIWRQLLNVEWEKVYGFPLFALVSLEPLKYLRGECRDAGSYHRRVVGVSELLERIDAKRLMQMLPDQTVAVLKKQKSGTVAVLDAVLQHLRFSCATAVISDLRFVQRLRNLPPTHSPDQGGKRAVEALNSLGFTYPVRATEWPLAWDKTRLRLERALEMLLVEVRAKAGDAR